MPRNKASNVSYEQRKSLQLTNAKTRNILLRPNAFPVHFSSTEVTSCLRTLPLETDLKLLLQTIYCLAQATGVHRERCERLMHRSGTGHQCVLLEYGQCTLTILNFTVWLRYSYVLIPVKYKNFTYNI